MAPLTRRAVKRQLRERSEKAVANDSTDVLVSISSLAHLLNLKDDMLTYNLKIGLDYTLFLQELVDEATRLAKADGSTEVLPSHFKQVKDSLLRKYRG